MCEPAATLESVRLRLRLIDARDAALYRALYTSPEVMRHIAPPLGAQEADAAFERVCRHNARAEPGHRYWAIVDRSSDEGLGLAALHRQGARAELGVMLLPGAWSRGVSREAFSVLLPYAFAAMGLEQVDAERPDDGHALRIDRLLRPFGFERAPPTRRDHARWTVTRTTVLLGFGRARE